MEFEITSDLALLRSQQITANFEAVAAWLDEELAPYAGMVVTDDMIPTAKTYRANIRKVKDRIEQYRKEAKSAALAPYNDFEAKCKVLTGKLDSAADNLDSQVKAYEKREADAKIAALREAYDRDEYAEAREYCPWEHVFNPKWANKGYSAQEAEEEIHAALYNTSVNLESIRQMGGEDTPYLLDIYRNTHDINAVIRKSLEIKAAREREEQRRREAEERRRVQAEAEAAAIRLAAEKAREPVVQEAASAVEEEPQDDDPVVEVKFKVICRKSKLVALGQYMKQNGILYGRA